MQYPAMIIFVNNDLSDSIKATLVKQLFIHESITGTEFDSRVAADPNYPTEAKLNGLRILVIRDFWELQNRELADVAIFCKHGIADIERDKYGPPLKGLSIDRLYIYELLTK